MDFILTWLASFWAFVLANLLPAALLLAVGILVIRIVMKLVKNILTRSHLEKAAHGLIINLIRIVLYLLLGLMVASRAGLDVSGVVALASVLTLAVSLSVQELLTNLISGFTLLYTKPFVSGDFVEIADRTGTVREIGLTYTKLATPDNKIVSIPNSAVTAAQIVNYTVTGTRRVDVIVTAAYDADPDTVMAALLAAAQVDTVLSDPAPFAGVRQFRDSTTEYMLQVWSTADNYWPTLFAVNKNIKAAFEAKGIALAYPHMNIHVEK